MLLDFYKNKNIFITGHTGFKGSWLSQILILAGAKVTGYALDAPTNPSLFDQLELSKKMNSIIGDIRDLTKLEAVIKKSHPDIVFHLAAQPLVLDSYKKPVETYEINVMGTVNLLQAVLGVNSIKSIVNVTTDKVYENKEWLWGYRENENLCGLDPYSNSKSCSELVTYSYRNSFYNLPDSSALSSARSGNVIGGGDYSENRIIPDCIKAALNEEKILVRNPNSTRPYQHVLECLRGYLTLAYEQSKNRQLVGAYNFGPDKGSCVTTGELVNLFCNLWGKGLSWETRNVDNPHEANFLSLDHTKATKLIGWSPVWDIKTAVQKTIDFAKCQSNKERQKCVEQQIINYFN